MPGRRLSVVVACAFLIAASVMLVLWLDSRTDTTLAHWSSVATVFSAVIAVLALIAAVVPLWPRDRAAKGARRDAPEPGAVVYQNIQGRNVNAAGRDQFNVNLRAGDIEQ